MVFPIRMMAITFVVWCIYCIFLVTSTLYPKCSLGNILLTLAIYPPLLAMSIYGVYVAQQIQIARPSTVLTGDINFKKFNIVPPIAVFFVGIICSLLGIGGSEITNPLLLYLHVLPQVSAGTVSMLSFWSTFATVIHDGAEKKVDYDVAWRLLIIGFCAGVFGRLFGVWFATKFGRPSILVFILVVVLVCTCAFYVYELSAYQVGFQLNNYCLQ